MERGELTLRKARQHVLRAVSPQRRTAELDPVERHLASRSARPAMSLLGRASTGRSSPHATRSPVTVVVVVAVDVARVIGCSDDHRETSASLTHLRSVPRHQANLPSSARCGPADAHDVTVATYKTLGLTIRRSSPIVRSSLTTRGRTGFDVDVDVRAARRGAHGHVKMGKPATANDNAVALAA